MACRGGAGRSWLRFSGLRPSNGMCRRPIPFSATHFLCSVFRWLYFFSCRSFVAPNLEIQPLLCRENVEAEIEYSGGHSRKWSIPIRPPRVRSGFWNAWSHRCPDLSSSSVKPRRSCCAPRFSQEHFPNFIPVFRKSDLIPFEPSQAAFRDIRWQHSSVNLSR